MLGFLEYGTECWMLPLITQTGIQQKYKAPSNVVNNLFEVFFDFSSIPGAKYDRFVLMHLHPPEAFRDAEWWGKKMPIPHSEYFLSRIIQILPFTKIITTAAEKQYYFIVDGNTEWAFWGR